MINTFFVIYLLVLFFNVIFIHFNYYFILYNFIINSFTLFFSKLFNGPSSMPRMKTLGLVFKINNILKCIEYYSRCTVNLVSLLTFEKSISQNFIYLFIFLLSCRFGLSNKFESEFPSALTGKVSVISAGFSQRNITCKIVYY